MKKMTGRSLRNQRGMATLLISLIVLVTITFIIFYTSRAVVMEQKMSTNDYRGRMAFEAAETGVEAAVAAVQQGWIITGNKNETTDIPILNTNLIVFDPDNDGAANNVNSYTLNNGSNVNVSLSNSSTREIIKLDITAIGQSDDQAATRTIMQTLIAIPPIPNIPDSPLLSRTAVAVGGSVQVSNPEGHSTIWSGGDISLGGNAQTKTEVASPNDAHYPDCLGGSVQCGVVESSNREVAGVDIIESDTALANLTDDQFFENFFGMPPETYKDSQADIVVDNTTTFIQNYATPTGDGKVIWVEGNTTLQANNTFGSATAPVIIIIDGNLTVAGTNNFNGMVFVRGAINGNGTVNAIGAMIVTGLSTSGGNVSVTYNSRMLERTSKSAKPSGSSGSWRDF